MRVGVIYSLNDPKNNEIRYIGQTICDPRDRLSQHKYQWTRPRKSTEGLTKVNSWIKNLFQNNLKPIMNIIESNIAESELDTREIYYIKYYRDLNYRLCNHTDGGKSKRGFKTKEESKIKRKNTILNSKTYKDSFIKISIHHKENYENSYLKEYNLKHQRKVRIFKEDNSFSKNFETLEEAAKYLNLKGGESISRCCTGKYNYIKKEYKAEFI